jgi:hypothetical protein
MTTARFRIFISSPSDVLPERERLDRVIARLNGEYGGGVLEAIRWERTYYPAAKGVGAWVCRRLQTERMARLVR